MRRTPLHLELAARSFSWIFLGATVAACNPDRVTAPRNVGSIEGLRPLFSGGFSGGSSIGVPGDNGPPADGGVAAFPIFDVPKGNFFRITVTGTVSTSHSGNCTPPVGTAGTWDAFGEGGGNLRVSFSTSPWIGGLPTGGQGTGTMIVNGGVTSATPVTFSASRNPYGAGCSGGPGLNLSGSQSIAWEVFPFFDVTASHAVVPPGDSITFVASSHWTTTGEFWKYRNNDTTSTPGGSGRGSVQVCSSSSTCKYAPGAPGRMYRVGSFPSPEGGQHDAGSPIVWVGSARPIVLQVSAPDSSVGRSDSTEATARNTGTGGELFGAELAWSFFPDSVELYPGKPKYNLGSPIHRAPGTDSTWIGRIVASGTIRLIATKDAMVDTAYMPVTVNPRSWGEPGVIWTEFEGDVIPLDSLWGSNIDIVSGDSEFQNILLGSYALAKVDDGGPNQGYWYVGGQDYYSMRGYLVTPWIRSDGPDSIPHGGGKISNYDLLALNSLDSLALWGGVVDHEGYGIGSTRRGHQAKVEDYIGDVTTCANPNYPTERVVGDSAAVAVRVESIRNQSARALGRAASHWNVHGNHSNSPYYLWLPPWSQFPHNDTVIADTLANTDATHCDWSGI